MVDDELKYLDLSVLFQMFKIEGCYYVEHGAIYTGEDWDDAFEKSEFSLQNGILSIEDLTHPETGEPLEFILSE